jgi:hypothetical protein
MLKTTKSAFLQNSPKSHSPGAPPKDRQKKKYDSAPSSSGRISDLQFFSIVPARPEALLRGIDQDPNSADSTLFATTQIDASSLFKHNVCATYFRF